MERVARLLQGNEHSGRPGRALVEMFPQRCACAFRRQRPQRKQSIPRGEAASLRLLRPAWRPIRQIIHGAVGCRNSSRPYPRAKNPRASIDDLAPVRVGVWPPIEDGSWPPAGTMPIRGLVASRRDARRLPELRPGTDKLARRAALPRLRAAGGSGQPRGECERAAGFGSAPFQQSVGARPTIILQTARAGLLVFSVGPPSRSLRTRASVSVA